MGEIIRIIIQDPDGNQFECEVDKELPLSELVKDFWEERNLPKKDKKGREVYIISEFLHTTDPSKNRILNQNLTINENELLDRSAIFVYCDKTSGRSNKYNYEFFDQKRNDISPNVFISYAREDYHFAQRIYNDLKRYRINAWLDTQELMPGQRWKFVIKKAIEKCTFFLALISENSINKRGFCQNELKFALEILDELPPDRIYLIPLRLDESKPKHDLLNELSWVDIFSDYENSIKKIIKVIIKKDIDEIDDYSFTSNIKELSVKITTYNSPWYTRMCPVCKGKFREGDKVRICPKCGKAYHDDERFNLDCFQIRFGSNGICTEAKFNPILNELLPECDFKIGYQIKKDDPQIGLKCPWCRFDIRIGDWIIQCPCGKCNTFFHQDPFSNLKCWSEWNSSGIIEYCPTTGAKFEG
jgi:hypothetical protein